MVKLGFMLLVTVIFFAQNPAMEGFNSENSDQKAIEIADKVMSAMGGYENWNNTQYIAWKFFGRRMHYWNKWTGDYRFENKNRIIVMNLNNLTGKMFVNGVEETAKDSLDIYLKKAKSSWINDSYWMFMPYKLKDSGVTLKYLSEGKMENGKAADILQLTFENVGDTPQNKYHIYVNKETNLVEQWDFYRNFNDKNPGFTTPWGNWKMYGKIMLSDERGKWKHTHINVFDDLDKTLFNSNKEIDFDSLIK